MSTVPAVTSATKNTRPQIGLTVIRREELSPHMVRIVAGGKGFAAYVNNSFVDRYVKIVFPQPHINYAQPLDLWTIRETMPREQWPFTRTYTVRWVDTEAQELAIDFVIHGAEGLAGVEVAAPQRDGQAALHTLAILRHPSHAMRCNSPADFRQVRALDHTADAHVRDFHHQAHRPDISDEAVENRRIVGTGDAMKIF